MDIIEQLSKFDGATLIADAQCGRFSELNCLCDDRIWRAITILRNRFDSMTISLFLNALCGCEFRPQTGQFGHPQRPISSGSAPEVDPDDASGLRQRLVTRALSEVGRSDCDRYWNDVAPQLKGDPHCCCAFILWLLRQEGLTSVNWVLGEGFLSTLQLPIVASPLPGDIAFWYGPQHCELVVEQQSDGSCLTVAAAQENGIVLEKQGRSADAYFSISKLVHED